MSSLDDPNLQRQLAGQLKSSYSTQGRAIDTALSHAHHLGGDAVAPSAMSHRRQEREQQLQCQRDISAAWAASASARTVGPALGDSAGERVAPGSSRAAPRRSVTQGVLQVPVLATVAPSFTKAADDGVAALGGTKMQGPGYTTVVGLVPTKETVPLIEDDYELVSSMRPYRYDAAQQERQAALRHTAAPPHPDLMRQLEPALAAVCPTDLVDVESLPRDYLLATARGPARADAAADGEGAGEPSAVAGDANGGAQPAAEQAAPRRRVGEGTHPFVAQGRPAVGAAARRLPGQRHPEAGQYNPRFGVVEPRVTGGYMLPAADVNAAAPNAGSTQPRAPAGPDGAPASAATSVMEADGMDSASQYAPGQNRKGSSMFLSRTRRGTAHGTAAPDTVYWPYPDPRSTVRRAPCGVRYDVPTHTRRREAPVSGVPSAVYNIGADLDGGGRRVVDMRAGTGRDAHWYGRRPHDDKPRVRDGRVIARSTDVLDVDAALWATRPAPHAVSLPPRGEPAAPRRANPTPPNTTVSVEMNLSFPPPVIGDPRKLARVRDFGHMTGRPQREPREDLRGALPPVRGGEEAEAGPTREDAYAMLEPRAPAALIHPRAPGHGSVAPLRTPTEFGEVPSLKLVRPNQERATAFGKGSRRPDHLLGFHDLSYHVESGYAVVEPRVCVGPPIGSVTSRQHREKVLAKGGSGPKDVLAYDNADPPRRVRSVPQFEKQITKETQFAGHRIQSERWMRRNPRAPAPGYYNVSYAAVM